MNGSRACDVRAGASSLRAHTRTRSTLAIVKAERTTLAASADGIAGALVAAVGLLAVANVVSNRLLPSSLYVPWNLLVAATLLVIRHARPPPAERARMAAVGLRSRRRRRRCCSPR